MADRDVQWDGNQVVTRKDRKGERVLNHRIHAELSDDGAVYEIASNRTEISIPLQFREPAELRVLRRIDHAQRNVELLEVELPELIRLPIGRLPNGFRLCWVCDGSGWAEDEFGFETDCENCHGDGYLPNAPADSSQPSA